MKPNDKAYAVARNVAYNRINKCFVFDLIKEAVDAAFAAQFQSEDYAGLVKELREDVLQFNLKNTAYENIANEAADAIETLLAKLNNKLKPSEDYAVLIDRLRFRAGIYKNTTDDRAAADALEALLAERESLTAAVLLSERQNDILTGDIDRLRVERNANIREKGKEDE